MYQKLVDFTFWFLPNFCLRFPLLWTYHTVHKVEAGTSFGRWFTAGEAPLPEDDTCADMYRTASRVLGRAGYDHYEVSLDARALVQMCLAYRHRLLGCKLSRIGNVQEARQKDA